ncbi:XRE family transcriptional regulator [Gottfriedia sp. NPDC056225]|uniref:XRE family transcriptional regulator n=1 Tax=Gottfriedia sp. NPDC056225 TaxID=3345751 RepID=UPI0035DE1410
MINVDLNSLPYQQTINYKMLRYIRLCLNLTQTQFGRVCQINQGVLAQLERGDIELSITYETRILEGLKVLNFSELEMLSVKKLVDLQQEQQQRGL